jgi:hypothetical protein
MPHPAETQIRAPSDADVYAAIKQAFENASDQRIIAELFRTVVFVAVSYNDIAEDGELASDVLDRQIFLDCDELAAYFPWPPT